MGNNNMRGRVLQTSVSQIINFFALLHTCSVGYHLMTVSHGHMGYKGTLSIMSALLNITEIAESLSLT